MFFFINVYYIFFYFLDMVVTWTLSQLVGKPESALFALTNDIKMNKRK